MSEQGADAPVRVLDERDAHDDHPDLGGGLLRASIFGASDGLVSNTALVLGVAAGGGAPPTVLLSGAAGLLAGGLSMAAGEWISVLSQREALEAELEREADHLARFPQAERAHMVRILERGGVPTELAQRVIDEVSDDPENALQFHARMELGIVPEETGRPVGAAVSSFLSFAAGALVPLLPWLVGIERGRLLATAALAAVALFGVGAAATRFTRRGWAFGGLRQLAVGLGAAGLTMAIARLFAV